MDNRRLLPQDQDLPWSGEEGASMGCVGQPVTGGSPLERT